MLRVYGGLAWPIDGNPAFFCLLSDKKQEKEKTLDEPLTYYEISHETESHSLVQMFEKIKEISRIHAIYVATGPKFINYAHELSKWRRENASGIQIRATQLSSFEAGIIKIKEYVEKGSLKFPEKSKVKAQLQILSKQSLKNENEFYAVQALCHVIGAFSRNRLTAEEKVPNIKAWY